ncbi:hypothetical protein B0A55_09058 [Friedmanniomyces simplex]|uniref:Uncharacterized protein n=1 Tax=Friedmanniomyces simplex TaxID=329884 RepID=A0A4U0X1S3_9PEZI|nr:hypothetical protein B0A55_09058 [Friedmanniomyces simplex]
MSHDEPPEIPILLLGDSGVGNRLTLGQNHPPTATLPSLHDLNQPFPFNIRLYARPYRFDFSDTASPTHYTLLRPAVIILCYSIADPSTLSSLKSNWKKVVETHFNYDEMIPVIVLGLQRDVREKEDYDGVVRTGKDRKGKGDIVYPQEALRVAQEMRCDRQDKGNGLLRAIGIIIPPIFLLEAIHDPITTKTSSKANHVSPSTSLAAGNSTPRTHSSSFFGHFRQYHARGRSEPYPVHL